MPEFQAQVFEPPRGLQWLRVHADSPAGVAQALGRPASSIIASRPVQAPSSQVVRGRRLDLRQFSQELALLLQSGIPLLEALETLNERGASGGALVPVITALRQGRPLSAALSQDPQTFDALFVAIVAASERSGQLVPALKDHAAYLSWSQGLRSKLVAAAVYPLLLLAAGLSVVVFLLLYVLPRFAAVFDGMGDSVPDASRHLIAFGVWASASPVLTGSLLAALPVAALLCWRWPAARQAVAQLLWNAPGLGPRWRVVALARLYRGLALLLAAGVPVSAAMRLLHGVMPAPLQQHLAEAARAVESGQRLSLALQAQALATPVAQRMLRVGEGSGELALMLERAATFHDEEIAQLSELVTRAVNPVLMLVMGVLIGGIVILMYLPIFSLMERVQ